MNLIRLALKRYMAMSYLPNQYLGVIQNTPHRHLLCKYVRATTKVHPILPNCIGKNCVDVPAKYTVLSVGQAVGRSRYQQSNDTAER